MRSVICIFLGTAGALGLAAAAPPEVTVPGHVQIPELKPLISTCSDPAADHWLEIDISQRPPAGAARVQKISGWTEIPQVLTIASQGGDPRYTTISPLARRNAINVPTGFNPTSITLTLGHDASNANYQVMLGISRALSKVAFKMALSGGAVTYGYGYMAVSELPSLNVNQANQVQASLTLLGRAMSYAS